MSRYKNTIVFCKIQMPFGALWRTLAQRGKIISFLRK
jgi:hypothetical protein